MTGRPNIVFVVANDWGRYASAYTQHDGPGGLNAFIKTPNFDRIAAEGVLFLNAFAPAPGDNPCRNSLLSGRYFWQMGLGAIEQGTVWDETIPTFPLELEKAGYLIGYTGEVTVKTKNIPIGGERTEFSSAGQEFANFSSWVTKRGPEMGLEAAKEALLAEVRQNFRAFLGARQEASQPFCYWWGPTNTHRTFEPGSGKALWGIDPDALHGCMPAPMPDVDEVRQDLADYLGEVMALDQGLGALIGELEALGELANTLLVVTGDHGMPGMPRAKTNLYGDGLRVPLAIRWPKNIPPGRVIEDFVNTMDLAPAFCQAGGIGIPSGMSARTLMPLLTCGQHGQVETERNFVISGRERHVSIAREGYLPYPQRALHTNGFCYLVNYEPDRWPMGDPHGLDDPSLEAVADSARLSNDTMLVFPDFDASPTKAWMICNRHRPDVWPLFQLAFGKRPSEELYDLGKDPHCMLNVSADPSYADTKRRLEARLKQLLIEQQDPRLLEQPCRYESAPYASIDAKYTTEKGQAMMEELHQRRSLWQRVKAKL